MNFESLRIINVFLKKFLLWEPVSSFPSERMNLISTGLGNPLLLSSCLYAFLSMKVSPDNFGYQGKDLFLFKLIQIQKTKENLKNEIFLLIHSLGERVSRILLGRHYQTVPCFLGKGFIYYDFFSQKSLNENRSFTGSKIHWHQVPKGTRDILSWEFFRKELYSSFIFKEDFSVSQSPILFTHKSPGTILTGQQVVETEAKLGWLLIPAFRAPLLSCASMVRSQNLKEKGKTFI